MHIHPSERNWIRFSIFLLAVFSLAIVLSAVTLGIRLPGREREPLLAAEQAGFPADEPWVRELGPGRYEVNFFANAFYFEPDTLEFPVGSTVTFYVHSNDVIHGFKILDTNVSIMAVPNQIGKLTYTFNEPGEFLFVCHEYCGIGHHVMHGRVIIHEDSVADASEGGGLQ